MRVTTRWITAGAFLAGLMATACGADLSKLPPIVITLPSPAPAKPQPPVTSEPPVVTPAPVPEPEPEPAPELPLVNLNIVVHDAAGVGINGATCVVSGEARRADGGGFINFAVRGSVAAECHAAGFVTAARELPPGDHRFPLERVAAPAPEPPTPTPTPGGVFVRCGAGENTLRISRECLADVAAVSPWYPDCNGTGNSHSCHLYVREVASALNRAQNTDRYGLITKPGGTSVNGYGEDVVAYLPPPFDTSARTWQWRGIDIIGGAGAPGASYQGGPLNAAFPCAQWQPGMGWCNREDNLWAPVPR